MGQKVDWAIFFLLLLYKKYLDFLIYIVAYWRISYWNHLKFYKQISIVVKTISMFYCPCRYYNRIIAIIALENVRFTKHFDICGLLSFDLMLLLISCISILCSPAKRLENDICTSINMSVYKLALFWTGKSISFLH